MKAFFYLFCLLCLAYLFSSCSDNDSNPTENNNQNNATVSSYYPGNVGSRFIYNDNSSIARIVNFTGIININGPDYIVQTSSNVSGTDTNVTHSFFRKTDAAIYFYVDTTGLSDYISDSLLNGISGISVQADNEINLLSSSFSSVFSWIAYNMNITYLIPFNVVRLNAYYNGNEDLVVNLTSGQTTKTAEKIRYELLVNIPSLTGTPETRSYNAYIWFVKDIGITKMEGNAAVLNAINGNGIILADTNKTMVLSLSSYEIK